MTAFRCHQAFTVDFSSGINLVYGSNGCGKTSLLEAIHLMACGRSFRRSKLRDLVCWQQSHYLLQGRWHRYGVMDVRVKGDRVSTTIALQGRTVASREELADHLALVVDSPQSERLIDGDPKVRRRWLDRLLLTLSPSVRSHYHHYHRAMLQRSRLVRQGADGALIAPWNQQMVVAGRAWIGARRQLVAELNALLAQERWIGAEPAVTLTTSAPESDAQWIEKLSSFHHPLRVGPHCDRIGLVRDGREVARYGSHGQQKLMAIAIRLAEAALRAESRHIYPLLLLDDCFAALDQGWQQQVMERLYRYPGQVVLTAPEAVAIADTGRQGRNRLIRLSSLENPTEVLLNGTA